MLIYFFNFDNITTISLSLIHKKIYNNIFQNYDIKKNINYSLNLDEICIIIKSFDNLKLCKGYKIKNRFRT